MIISSDKYKMQKIFVSMVTIVTLLSTASAEETTATSFPQIESGTNGDEYDSDSARKIIGSRVVTSVSVVMNGKEPQFADAVGNFIPRPLVPPRVASPVSLLDPDRYEFYTFNDDGELVKRLMTMGEIQSIVANGDSEQQALAKNPTGFVDNEANIRDIVNNVQKVLHSEMANNNFTASLMYNKLDTPDTSSSWSSILPAIFGNTGESILANKTPVTTGSTADSIIMHTTQKKPQIHKTPSTPSIVKSTLPPKTTISKLNKQKPQPSRPASLSSTVTTFKPNNVVTQKTKHTSTAQTTQKVKNTIAPPISKNKYSQQNVTFTAKPTKTVTVIKPSSTPTKISTAYLQKITQSTHKGTPVLNKTSSTISHTTSTKKPVSKRPATQTKPPLSIQTTKIPLTVQYTSTKKKKITQNVTNSPIFNTYVSPILSKKKTHPTTKSPYKTTKIAFEEYTPLETLIASSSTYKYTTTSALPPTTQKTVTYPIQPTTRSPPQTINPDSVAVIEPEPDNVFDSELSLNQIIESLKDLEGTTMNYASNYMDFIDMTTTEPNTMRPFDNSINDESVTIVNNGQNSNIQPYSDDGFKQSAVNGVSYIPQTTMDFLDLYPTTDNYINKMKNYTKNTSYYMSIPSIEHKESDDEMVLTDEKTSITTNMPEMTTTDNLSKQSTNSMDSLLRESFDSVLFHLQNDGVSTTIDYNDIETSTISTSQSDYIPIKSYDKKKIVVKPTPNIPIAELEAGATEPMKYFETVIKQYEQEKNKNETVSLSTETTTKKSLEDILIKTTEKLAETSTESTLMLDSIEITTQNSENEELATKTVIFDSNKNVDENETTTEFSTEDISSENLKTEKDYFSSEGTTLSVTSEPEEVSTIHFLKESNVKGDISMVESSTENDEFDISTRPIEDITTETMTEFSDEPTTDAQISNKSTESDQLIDDNQTQYQMIQLIENIMKNFTNEKTNKNFQNATNIIERKEDINELSSKTVETTNRDDTGFSDLGETTTSFSMAPTKKYHTATKTNVLASSKIKFNKLKLPTLAPILNNLKMKVVNALKNTNTINLEPAPKQALGLEESTAHVGEDILEFTKFCNEVAFNFWTALNNEGISSARSLTLSPFALTSMLAMLFLGARGRTSGEINDMLHLDDIVSFNPHAMLRNISESIDEKRDENVFSNAFVRELLSERSKGKILPFFKEKVSQFYSGYVEEVNFNTVNDVIRRRTNMLIKRYTSGKVNEYLKASNVWVKPPLSGISANIFETDCSKASKVERDGEMFFQVLPAIRQRRLVPVPAVVWKSEFTAGYDPELDATAVAIGLSKNVISTIFVMPGQQGHSAPGDNLERLESVLMVNAVSQNAWRRLLATLMERPGLEVQIPRFTHRSFVNTTNALRKLGLETLFDQNLADLRGITGSIGRDMYVSDLIQINTFSTCGEDKLAEEHHVEMYPAPPNKHRTIEYSSTTSTLKSTVAPIDYENERAFASDPIYNQRYLNLPLPLRPRQARIPDIPRLRFDKPFIYFVRHNPTGMVLYFGRFNPRLLP